MKKVLMPLSVVVLVIVAFASHAGSPLSVPAEDQRQILDVISASSYTYDGKDLEGYLALYTKDCTWEAYASGASVPMVRAAGLEELRAIVAQRLAMLKQKGVQSRHYQTNTVLSAHADGQVGGSTMLNLTWQVPGEKPYTSMTGIYRDLFVKADGRWKIAKRTLLMDQGDAGK